MPPASARKLFDAHFHIIDPAHPLVANHGFTPDPFEVTDYRAATAAPRLPGFEVAGGAVVSGSFQAYD